ncbi:hypothetical protein [Victivallis vadensis]|uniref:Uncharacterized protein n=1 Tax=Victivallis vadensis TaxID=172901 RepID=A0A2U1AU31_9BACT|nr:hypothetical protein [Victivallis vadensis]PVY39777.1 hypothetical protein C8D82_11918 [Victivallis vadensis]
MSRKKRPQVQQEQTRQKQESHEQKEEKEDTQAQVQIPSNAPATTRQRELLRLAVQREWLYPNPFACDHAKWKNLTAGEADQLLASLPRERLGILERELNEEQRRRADHGIARAIGRGLEDVIRQIGHSIDGGIS